MTQVIAVVTGLSGVGKSWLLEKVHGHVPAQVISAGDLIAAQLRANQTRIVDYDGLREQDIDANQRALELGFAQHLDPKSQIVILDAHVVIDTPKGLEFINAEVFSKLGATLVIFIEEDPSRILQNRSQDESRIRPLRNQNTLKAQQAVAKKSAHTIALKLGVPWHVLRAGDVEGLINVLLNQNKV